MSDESESDNEYDQSASDDSSEGLDNSKPELKTLRTLSSNALIPAAPLKAAAAAETGTEAAASPSSSAPRVARSRPRKSSSKSRSTVVKSGADRKSSKRGSVILPSTKVIIALDDQAASSSDPESNSKSSADKHSKHKSKRSRKIVPSAAVSPPTSPPPPPTTTATDSVPSPSSSSFSSPSSPSSSSSSLASKAATGEQPAESAKRKGRRSHHHHHLSKSSKQPDAETPAFQSTPLLTGTAAALVASMGGKARRRSKKGATLGRGSFPGGLVDVAKELSPPETSRSKLGGSKSGEALNIATAASSSSSPSSKTRVRRRARSIVASAASDAIQPLPSSSSSSSSPQTVQSTPAASSSPSPAASSSQSPAVDDNNNASWHKLSLLDAAAQFGDVHFLLSSSTSSSTSTELFAHSYVLRVRCASLYAQIVAALSSHKGHHSSKSPPRRHPYRVDWQPVAGRLLLDYLYSDELAPRGIDSYTSGAAPVMLSVVELLVLAEQFGLARLVSLCQRHIADNMNHELACPVLLRSSQSPALADLKEFMLDYCHREGRVLARNREAMQILGLDLLQETMARFIVPYDAAAAPQFVRPLPPRQLVADMQRLLVDTVGSGQQQGFPAASGAVASVKLLDAAQPVYFHPAVLADHSPQLAQAFAAAAAAVVDYDNELRISKKISADGFVELLRYCYWGHRDFSVAVACQLAIYAQQINMAQLRDIADALLAAPSSLHTDTVLRVLDVTYSKERKKEPHIAQLHDRCFDYMAANFADLDFASSKLFVAPAPSPQNPAFDFLVFVQRSISSHQQA